MIPDMSDVLSEFEITVNLDTYQLQSVNFVETMVKTSSVPISAVIQPASQERLQSLQIDFSLRYIQIHATTQLNVGQYIVYNGVNYKIITSGDYQLYGFSDVVGEETKGAIT
jgi:hypothetical protein